MQSLRPRRELLTESACGVGPGLCSLSRMLRVQRSATCFLPGMLLCDFCTYSWWTARTGLRRPGLAAAGQLCRRRWGTQTGCPPPEAVARAGRGPGSHWFSVKGSPQALGNQRRELMKSACPVAWPEGPRVALSWSLWTNRMCGERGGCLMASWLRWPAIGPSSGPVGASQFEQVFGQFDPH